MIIRSSRLARFVRILEVYTKQHYNREEEGHTTSLSGETIRCVRLVRRR